MITSSQIIAGGLLTIGVIFMVGSEVSRNEPPRATATPIYTPKSSASPTITPTVVPARKPAVKAIQTSAPQQTPSDPIVACNFPKSGTLHIPESQCYKMTDCQIEDGTYKAVWKSDCQALRNRQARELQELKDKTESLKRAIASSSTITCILSYGTYQLTPQDCESSKNRDQELTRSLSTKGYSFDPTAYINSLNQIVRESEIDTQKRIEEIQALGKLPPVVLSTPMPCPTVDYYDGNRGSQGSISSRPVGCP